MKLKRNNVKEKLRNGEVCFGTMLRILKSPQAVPMCASEGWDFIVLDTEHNDYDYETLADFCLVSKYVDMSLFVRVPDKLYHQMARVLDIGAEGLILPQVKSKEEAERIIRSTKYSPWGKRGVSVSSIQTLFEDYSVEDYTEWSNREIMIVVQIESEEGVNNAGQILSTKGIDAVMIGPADMTADMGIPSQIHHPRVEAAFREIIHQCNKYGVAPGIHLNNPDDVKKWISEGMRFITYRSDTKFFKDASREALNNLRSYQIAGKIKNS